jgi:type IV secretion system protein VirB4
VSDSTGLLCSQLPWNFVTKFHEGVVVQKDGILQRTFAYRAPDTDSLDAFEVNGVCLRVNDFAKRLGTGWAFQIEAQRFYTREYPRADFAYRAGDFDALAPYLIDREREAAFRAAGKHFESSYYLTFIWRPPSENIKKLTQMFIQAGSPDAKNGIKYLAAEPRGIVFREELILMRVSYPTAFRAKQRSKLRGVQPKNGINRVPKHPMGYGGGCSHPSLAL